MFLSWVLLSWIQRPWDPIESDDITIYQLTHMRDLSASSSLQWPERPLQLQHTKNHKEYYMLMSDFFCKKVMLWGQYGSLVVTQNSNLISAIDSDFQKTYQTTYYMPKVRFVFRSLWVTWGHLVTRNSNLISAIDSASTKT